MSSKYDPKGMDRRMFLKMGTLGVAGAGATSRLASAQGATKEEPGLASSSYRVLGNTGLKVSVVSIGAMRTDEAAVLRAAFDRGVNMVDTARVYKGGRNEATVREALQGMRDKIHICTKVKPGDKETMLRDAATCLRTLGTDHVEVMHVHAVSSKEDVMNETWREAMAQLQKEGKIRFKGVSTHSNEADVLNAVVDDPDRFYDVVLVAYNFQKPPELTQAIERASKAGVGIIAMKTQAGGYETTELGDISPHQAALKWVLNNPNVHCAIPAMVNLKEVEEDTEVLGMKFTRTDAQILDRYGKAIASRHCRGCAECDGACPQNVDIRTVNRSLMYAEGYRDMTLARDAYQSIPPAVSAAACGDCGACTAVCPNGIDIRERMQKAREILA